MALNEEYTEVISKLRNEVAIVAFYKKNGTFRTMLATRNINTSAIHYGYLGRQLGGHDSRCNMGNGNIAVIDLVIGEARSFNIERVVDITWLGVITTPQQLDKALKVFMEYTDNYKKATIGMGLFDSLGDNKGESKGSDEQTQESTNKGIQNNVHAEYQTEISNNQVEASNENSINDMFRVDNTI